MMTESPDKHTSRAPGLFLKWILAFAGLVLVLEIPLLISHARHGYFKVDGWFAFYAILGLAAPGLLFAVSRVLGFALRRPLDQGGAVDNEPLPEDLDEQLR